MSFRGLWGFRGFGGLGGLWGFDITFGLVLVCVLGPGK
jgi:hypothetical protein